MIKKLYRKIYRYSLGMPLSVDEFKYIISEILGIKKGDSILVHSSYGNLKAAFSPRKAVEILMDIIGYEGNILMPYYPELSRKWLEDGNIFDVRSTPTQSGILALTFSTFPDVKKSLHPIKSLAVWGKHRDYLIVDHHKSLTPYDEHSPYYKLLLLVRSKTVGLGSYKNSFAHCAEDIDPNYTKYYSKTIYQGKCIDYSGNSSKIGTKVHIKNNHPRFTDYLINTNCSEFKITTYRRRLFYIGLCKNIAEHFASMSIIGLTPYIYQKRNNQLRNIINTFLYKLNG